MPAVAPEFDLFISYVRRDVHRTINGRRFNVVDELKLALERELHPLDRHRFRPRRFRVCTDREDLDLSGTVSEAVRRAIDRSEMLLVVCSLGVPSSRYVLEEIEIFHARGTAPLAAFLDLSPHVAFPEVYDTDTLVADLAPEEGTTVEEYRRRLADEARKIVALVWGVSQGSLRDRFAVQRRWQRRLGAAIIAITLAITGGAVLVTATRHGLHGVAELHDGPHVVPPAGVGFLAGGTPYLAGNGQLAVWRGPRPETRNLPQYALQVIAISSGAVVVRETDRVVLLEPETGEEKTLLSTSDTTIAGLAASDHGYAAVTEDGRLLLGDFAGHIREAPRPSLTVGRKRPPAFQKTGPLEWGMVLAWDRDGRWLASATLDGQLYVFDTRDERFVSDDPLAYETENSRPIGSVAFIGSPARVLVAEGIGVRALDLATGALSKPLVDNVPLLRELAVRPDGHLLVGASTETLEVFSLDDAGIAWRDRVNLSPKSIPELAWSPSGELLLVGYFDAPPDLFRITYRAFGIDLWPISAGGVLQSTKP